MLLANGPWWAFGWGGGCQEGKERGRLSRAFSEKWAEAQNCLMQCWTVVYFCVKIDALGYWLNLARALMLYYLSATAWAFAQKSNVQSEPPCLSGHEPVCVAD